MATTTQDNIRWLARAVVRNDNGCYAVLLDDGDCEVGPAACYSAILQCGHNPRDYGIVAMIQCGDYDDIDDAISYVEGVVADA